MTTHPERDDEWYSSRAFVRTRPEGDRRPRRTKHEKEQDVMRVVAALMGAGATHCPNGGDTKDDSHDFELTYADKPVAWGEECLWGATWEEIGTSKKRAAYKREGPHKASTAPTYVGEEWNPDLDLQFMLQDRSVQAHFDKVCRYRIENGIEENHLVLRAYSPLSILRAIRPAREVVVPVPIPSRLPINYVSHIWVMSDFFEWVAHLTEGLWTLKPMPYLFPEFNDHYSGPNRPAGWPEYTQGSSWLPPL